MANEENLKGKGFESRPENINKSGRPKKIYTILKEKGYCKDDITLAFGELAFYNESELNDLLETEAPIITKIVAKTLLKAFDDANYSLIREILEHVIGKPLIKTEQKITDTTGVKVYVNSKEEKKKLDKFKDNL